MPATPSHLVAVVIPFYNRSYVTPDEELSFRHLRHYLGHYDKYLLVPRSLSMRYPGCEVMRFPDHFFGSHLANTRLMLSRDLYRAFSEYKYILVYQSDALVFSDQLQAWCDTDLDYIGAPWLKSEYTPFIKVPRVGNGGFSLRKVSSFLGVLGSDEYWTDPHAYWATLCRDKPQWWQWMNLPRKYRKYLKRYNGVSYHIAHWLAEGKCYEDIFWAYEATHYYPEFKIADAKTGLRFAFEVMPRTCFELNDRQLPFGCHAWARYDKDFWTPFLLK
jgi:hypothetical protein